MIIKINILFSKSQDRCIDYNCKSKSVINDLVFISSGIWSLYCKWRRKIIIKSVRQQWHSLGRVPWWCGVVMVVGIVLVVMVVLHSLPYLGARFSMPAMARMRVRITNGTGGSGSGRSSNCGCLILRRRDRILLLMLLLLLMVMLLLLLLLRLLCFVVPWRTWRSYLLIRRGSLSPFAIPIHRIHLREWFERVASGVGRVRRRVGWMRRRGTITTVVPGWCAWWRRAPHQYGLSRHFIAIYLGFDVFDLRCQHTVGCASYRRASGGIARWRTTFQRVPTSGAYHIHISRYWMHRGCSRHGTGTVGRTADASRVSRLYIAIFGWLVATELLTVELLLCLTG